MRTKQDLILMPCWTYREIMEYFGIKSKTTAIKVKNRAIKEQFGSVPYGSQFVKTDSVLALYGTSRLKEMKLYEEKILDKEIKS